MSDQQNNSIQIEREIINELKKSAINLGHSPKKREILNLATRSHRYFGSFNKAKSEAGLKVKNVRITKFPKNAFKLDKDMASIVSYVTFDGHLYKDLKGFYYSSKKINDLKDFEVIVKRKFGLPPRYHLFSAGSSKQTHIIYFFNKISCT